MFGTTDLVLFTATASVLIATPGVDMMLTLARTLQFGIRGGIVVVLGIGAGCVVHTLAAALGLAALMAASSAAFAFVKWAGAAYLLWLALGMLRSALTSRAAIVLPDSVGRPDAAALFRQGLYTNVLNPKVALFFLALLPQFIAADAPNKPLTFLFLGAWFTAQGVLFLIVFALLVAPLARRRASDRWRRALNAAGAGLFAWLAARLALVERT